MKKERHVLLPGDADRLLTKRDGCRRPLDAMDRIGVEEAVFHINQQKAERVGFFTKSLQTLFIFRQRTAKRFSDPALSFLVKYEC